MLEVDFVGRLAGFVLGLRVALEVVLLVVLVVGISLGAVYSSHFGPITSLMPFQRSSLFAEEVDLTELTDLVDEDKDVLDLVVVVVFGFFQISNLPLVELEMDFAFKELVELALFPPFQNRNPPTRELENPVDEVALTEDCTEILVVVALSNLSRLCNCLLSVNGSTRRLQKYGRRRTARPTTIG